MKKKKYVYDFYFDGHYLTAYPKKIYSLQEAIEDFMYNEFDEFIFRDIEHDERFLAIGEGYVRYGFYRNEDTEEREQGYYITVEKKKTYCDCWCVCFKGDNEAVGFLEESKKWRDENERNNIAD